MKKFIEFIAKQLVDNPDNVIVKETTPDENTVELTLKVDKCDIGKVIGKHGDTVNAMRTLLIAVGGKEHRRVTLKIIELPEHISHLILVDENGNRIHPTWVTQLSNLSDADKETFKRKIQEINKNIASETNHED